MKITKKFANTFRCAYLNTSDKSVVVWHTERDKLGIEKQWATLHKFPDLNISQNKVPEGSSITCLGIDSVGVLRLIANSPRIDLWWDSGSEASKNKNIRIEMVSIDGPAMYGYNRDTVYITNIPELISGQFFFKLNSDQKSYETLVESGRWADMKLLVVD